MSDIPIYKEFKNGVWYIIEKIISEEQLNAWIIYANEELEYVNEYSTYSPIPPNKGYVKQDYDENDEDAGVSIGTGAFLEVLENFNFQYDLYIAYCSPHQSPTFETIEMYMTVTTFKNAPMSTHMGINRSIQYMLYSLKNNIPLNRYLSVNLHAYAAKTILQIYPNKIYMITNPVKSMSDILLKEMGNDIYVGTNATAVTIELRNKIKEEEIYINSLYKKIKLLPEGEEKSELKKFLNKYEQIDTKLLYTDDILKQVDKSFKTLSTFFSSPIFIDSQRYKNIYLGKYFTGIVVIYDTNKNIVYYQNYNKNVIILPQTDQEFHDNKKFIWFNRGPMMMLGYITIPLDKLAAKF